MDVFKSGIKVQKPVSFSKDKRAETDKIEEGEYGDSGQKSNIQVGELVKTNRGQITLRKSLEFGKVKIPDDLVKRNKPIHFKNLNKKHSNKISMLKNNTSENSGNASIKTNENN